MISQKHYDLKYLFRIFLLFSGFKRYFLDCPLSASVLESSKTSTEIPLTYTRAQISKEISGNSLLQQEAMFLMHFSSEAMGKGEFSNTRTKRLRMRKVSIFKISVANANFTTRTPFFELKSNFISIQNFKAGNFKPPSMHWSKDFQKVCRDRARKPLIQTNSWIAVLSVYVRFQNETKASVDFQT